MLWLFCFLCWLLLLWTHRHKSASPLQDSTPSYSLLNLNILLDKLIQSTAIKRNFVTANQVSICCPDLSPDTEHVPFVTLKWRFRKIYLYLSLHWVTVSWNVTVSHSVFKENLHFFQSSWKATSCWMATTKTQWRVPQLLLPQSTTSQILSLHFLPLVPFLNKPPTSQLFFRQYRPKHGTSQCKSVQRLPLPSMKFTALDPSFELMFSGHNQHAMASFINLPSHRLFSQLARMLPLKNSVSFF